MPPTTPWMTAAEAPEPESNSPERPMPLHCLQPVLGAGRREAAAQAQRRAEGGQERRDRQTIKARAEDQDVLRGIHAVCFSRPTRCIAAKKSFSTSAKLFPLIGGRATSTRSSGCASRN